MKAVCYIPFVCVRGIVCGVCQCVNKANVLNLVICLLLRSV